MVAVAGFWAVTGSLARRWGSKARTAEAARAAAVAVAVAALAVVLGLVAVADALKVLVGEPALGKLDGLLAGALTTAVGVGCTSAPASGLGAGLRVKKNAAAPAAARPTKPMTTALDEDDDEPDFVADAGKGLGAVCNSEGTVPASPVVDGLVEPVSTSLALAENWVGANCVLEP